MTDCSNVRMEEKIPILRIWTTRMITLWSQNEIICTLYYQQTLKEHAIKTKISKLPTIPKYLKNTLEFYQI
jgi:hypothetical protein